MSHQLAFLNLLPRLLHGLDLPELRSAATSTSTAYTTSVYSPLVVTAASPGYLAPPAFRSSRADSQKVPQQYPSNFRHNLRSLLRIKSPPSSKRARCPSYSALVQYLSVAFPERARRLWSQRNPPASTGHRALTPLAVCLLPTTLGCYT